MRFIPLILIFLAVSANAGHELPIEMKCPQNKKYWRMFFAECERGWQKPLGEKRISQGELDELCGCLTSGRLNPASCDTPVKVGKSAYTSFDPAEDAIEKKCIRDIKKKYPKLTEKINGPAQAMKAK